MNYVFVYGTLLKDERNHYLLENSEYIGSGYIKDYYMFNLGTYPGIQKGNGKVLGEVYKVNKTTEDLLDQLEEVGYLYDKVLEKIILDNNEEISAYVYVYILVEIKDTLHLNEYNWKQLKKGLLKNS